MEDQAQELRRQIADHEHRIHVLEHPMVPRAELLPTALSAADAIASNAPLAVRETRRGVRELLGLSLAEGYRRQEEIGAPLRKTEDAREGARAFAERRPPVWQGR